ncbi:MAG: hypothetical protein DBX59_07830 [Bacillota bacterium]|nr:MAG: hypothetical protein DBX59_07830 [Bacillota bacterium]
MGECTFYEYKEGDYHCSLSNHDIGDNNHVKNIAGETVRPVRFIKMGKKPIRIAGPRNVSITVLKKGTTTAKKPAGV